MVKIKNENFLKILRKYIHLNSKQIDRFKVLKNGSIIVPLPALDEALPPGRFRHARLDRASRAGEGTSPLIPRCFAAAPRGN